MRLGVLLVALATISCGGKQPGGGTTAASGGGTGTGGASGSAGSAAVVAPAPLTRDECGALVGHIFDLGTAEQKKTWKPTDVPTDDQLAKSRAGQIQQHADECVQMNMPRTEFDCAMNASDSAALEKCDAAAGSAR